MKIYTLIEKETRTPVSIFIKEEKSNEAALSGIILNVDSTNNNEITELSFIAKGYIKFDGCSHFNFRGQEFKNDDTKSDSYYHLCGFESLHSFIRNLSFMWQLAIDELDMLYELGESDQFVDFRDSSGVLDAYKISEEIVDENNNKNLYKLLIDYKGEN